MVRRYFMSALRRRRSALRAAFTLPTTQARATDKSGALALLIVAPAQMLDDPVRVADRIAADDEQRHAVLAGQGHDLVALGLAPRHAPLLDLQAVPAQPARHAPARAQQIRRRATAIEDHRSTSRIARPSSRQPS